MPVRATCPACGVALFTPSDGYSAEAMVERHQRFGRCGPGGGQVERSAVTEEDGRDARRAARGGRLA
ncbi:MAG: hypothetical protein QOJ09_2211 [Actinomycetota bacterium]|jgi:Na+-translocating ferredoxin:NAD+ oxidoreductase RNF subunit RnfB|nr:hypothetical protein [Actinomycetota bacterium]